MALSLNEIKGRALKFSNEWKDDTSEDAEAKSFLKFFLMFLRSAGNEWVVLSIK
jgi:hypothetical protein